MTGFSSRMFWSDHVCPTLIKDHGHECYLCPRGSSRSHTGVHQLEYELPKHLDIFFYQHSTSFPKHVARFFKHSIWGDGHHPSHDPFGRPFSKEFHPSLFALAGSEIMPGYRAVLEAVQADQDFGRIVFALQHYYGKKHCCHYCPVIQWTSRNPHPGEPNDPNDLYTNFAADASRKTPSWHSIVNSWICVFLFFGVCFY